MAPESFRVYLICFQYFSNNSVQFNILQNNTSCNHHKTKILPPKYQKLFCHLQVTVSAKGLSYTSAMLRILILLLACALSAQAQQYDLVLRNGHVLDPKNNVDAKRDVAIRDGKIAAIEPSIPATAAKQSVDISGLYLTPGLVDIHVHIFTGLRHNAWGNGDLSVPVDP